MKQSPTPKELAVFTFKATALILATALISAVSVSR